MAITFQELVAKVGLDTKEYKKGLADIRDDSKSTQQGVSKVALGIGAAFVVGGAFAVKAASDLGEQVNKTNVVFGKNGKEVNTWATGLADNFGLSQRAALEAAGTYGNMLKPMGLMPNQVASISKEFVQLAGDMASFNNADPAETLDALRAGLAGETEPLRRFGVFLSQARVEAEAMSLGLTKTKVSSEAVTMAQERLGIATNAYTKAVREHGAQSEQTARAKLTQEAAENSLEKAMAGTHVQLTAASKAMAIHSLIMKDTQDAQGDFARTAASLPNTMRTLRADVENLAAGFGQQLLPAAVKVAGGLKSILGFMQDHEGAVKAVIGVVGGLTAAYLIYTTTAKVAAATTGVFTAAQTAYRVATGAATAEQVALNAAMRANVIGIVITAIAALAVGVIYAYQHFETFRKVVDTVFKFVKNIVGDTVDYFKDHWQDALVLILTGPFGLAIKKIADHFGGIRKLAYETVLQIVEPFSHLPGSMGGWARKAKDQMHAELAQLDVAKAIQPSLAAAHTMTAAEGRAAGAAYAAGFAGAESEVLAAGLSEHAAIRKQMAEQDRAGAVTAVTDTAAATAEAARRAAAAVVIPAFKDTGVKAAQAVGDGIASKKAEVAQKAADVAQRAADKAADVLDRAKDKLGKKFDIFSTFTTRAFQALNGADLTPAEQKLKELRESIDSRDIQSRVDDAKTALATAASAFEGLSQHEGETDADFAARKASAMADRLSAEKAFRDAQEAQTISSLQTQADVERKDLDNRQAMEQMHFETRLANLNTYLESGHATAKEATKRIKDLLSTFGLDMSDIGSELGTQFAQGLLDSIPNVVEAAKAVKKAAATAADTTKEANLKKKAAAAASAAASKSASRFGMGDLMTGSESDVGPSAPSGNLVSIGRWLQGLGFQVGENPAFGGVAPVHAKNSYHYQGRAIDVNWAGGGSAELSKLQWLYGQLSGKPHVELLLEDAGTQNQHLHFAMAKGGIFTKHTRAMFDVAEKGSPEAFIPLGDPRAAKLLGGGGGNTFVFTGNSFLTSDRETQRAIWNMLAPFADEGQIQVVTG